MEELNYLWRFDFPCGRSGDLEGLFVATELEVRDMIGQYAYFGEVLGKHSEICGYIKEDHISQVDINPEAVETVAEVLGFTWSGFNPKHYIRYSCRVCEVDDLDYDEYNEKTKTCWDCC